MTDHYGTVLNVIFGILILGVMIFAKRKEWFPEKYAWCIAKLEERRRKRAARSSASTTTQANPPPDPTTKPYSRWKDWEWKKWLKWPVIAVLVIVGLAIGWHFAASTTPKLAGSTTTPATNSSETSRGALLSDKQKALKAQVEEILDQKDLKPGQKELLLALFECESSWNQFEENGTTPYHARKLVNGALVLSETNVIGLGQINMDAHAAEVARCTTETGENCDPATLEGNINMSLWILNTYGPERWVCYDKVRTGVQETRAVKVPVSPEWSELVPIRVSTRVRFTGVVVFKTDDGQLHRCEDGKGCTPAVNPTDSLQFQLETEEGGTILLLPK